MPGVARHETGQYAAISEPSMSQVGEVERNRLVLKSVLGRLELYIQTRTSHLPPGATGENRQVDAVRVHHPVGFLNKVAGGVGDCPDVGAPEFSFEVVDVGHGRLVRTSKLAHARTRTSDNRATLGRAR